MEKRIILREIEPDAYKAMLTFDKYLSTTSLTPTHVDLLKIRASQINGCAFCIDMHTKEARHHGETEQRIYGLSAWRETPFFTEEERAILALTEEVTLINHHVAQETYQQAATLLGDKYLAQVLMAIISINAWNRIGIATGMSPALG
ncbi:carboxymuconolactone decarboxylase family protein [Spirosoma jeollabukense]